MDGYYQWLQKIVHKGTSAHHYIHMDLFKQQWLKQSVMNGCVNPCSLPFLLTLRLLLTKDCRVAASMDLLSVIASHGNLFLAQYFIQMVVQIRQSTNISERADNELFDLNPLRMLDIASPYQSKTYILYIKILISLYYCNKYCFGFKKKSAEMWCHEYLPE